MSAAPARRNPSQARRGNAPTYWHSPDDVCLGAVQRAWVEEGRIGQTVRHYYYKLLSAGHIKLLPHKTSSKNAYNYVSKLLSSARMGEILPWSAVVDPGRRSFTHYYYESLADYLRAELVVWFPVDVWRHQPRRLEVWVEKDGLAEMAHDAVRRWRVPIYVAKGYGSATLIKDAAERYGNGRGWTLLYAGDFDPSGLDIERNLRDTLRLHGARPEILRVGLTQEDTWRLPPEAALALKKDDLRTKGFIQMYGPDQRGYELDALPAGQLRQMLQEAVVSRMDLDELRTAADIEREISTVIEARLRDVFAGLEQSVLSEGIPESDLPLDALWRYLLPEDEI
jgi:hypothetical protein